LRSLANSGNILAKLIVETSRYITAPALQNFAQRTTGRDGPRFYCWRADGAHF
jgi:hypothetical protein